MESPHEEPLKDKSRKKMRNKSNKQATVLKQLNNQNLYPLQERIGIYVVAALSALGLILITYTGVMALVSTSENETYAPVDVDVDDVSDMLGDLDDLLDDEDVIDQDTDDSDQYVASDDGEPEDSESGATIGIINENAVHFLREPDSTDAMLALQEGDAVILIDFDYNAYWAHVEIETDAMGTLRGFIERRFIDVEE